MVGDGSVSLSLCFRTWFDSYFRANAANLPARLCGERCRQVQTCAIANVDYDDFRMCVTTAKALSANDGVATAAGRQVLTATNAAGLGVATAALLWAATAASSA